MAQNKLFNMGAPVKKEVTKRELSRPFNIPKEGDIVQLLNINGGIEAVVEYVDMVNIYQDHFSPIQCRVPTLDDTMIRTTIQNVKIVKAT